MRLLAVLVLTVMSLTAGSMAQAQACPARDDLAYIGSEPGAALADCRELLTVLIPTGLGDVKGKIYGNPATDSAISAALGSALVRAGETLRGLGAYGSDPVDLYISPTPYVPAEDESADAVADRLFYTGPDGHKSCLIATFLGREADYNAYVVAHEFFHCVENFQYNDQSANSSSEWWMEGAAEWFANRAFPGRSYSDDFVADFDEGSEKTPITELPYANVVFFFWLDQNFGPTRVFDLMRAMPTSSGSQEDALDAFLGAENFQKFAEDYIDRKIRQPGGRTIPSTPIMTVEYSEDSSGDETLESERFTIARAWFLFACTEWDLTDADVSGKYGLQRHTGAEWNPAPMHLDPESGQEIRIRIAATGTKSGGFHMNLKFRKKECALCDTSTYSSGPEAALVGHWVLASGGYGAKMQDMLQGMEGFERVEYPDLDKHLILNSDGTFILSSNDQGKLDVSNNDGDVFKSVFDIQLQKQGTWSIDGNRLSQCYTRETEVSINDTVTSPEGEVEHIKMPEFLGPPTSYTVNREFLVLNNHLKLTEHAILAPTITWEYSK